MGNPAGGDSIYEAVRRRVKRRYSFIALLFVFGTGVGLLAVVLANSRFAR
jgi:hypothetical protein